MDMDTSKLENYSTYKLTKLLNTNIPDSEKKQIIDILIERKYCVVDSYQAMGYTDHTFDECDIKQIVMRVRREHAIRKSIQKKIQLELQEKIHKKLHKKMQVELLEKTESKSGNWKNNYFGVSAEYPEYSTVPKLSFYNTLPTDNHRIPTLVPSSGGIAHTGIHKQYRNDTDKTPTCGPTWGSDCNACCSCMCKYCNRCINCTCCNPLLSIVKPIYFFILYLFTSEKNSQADIYIDYFNIKI